MRARVVVFPIKGRNWCFSRSIDHSASNTSSAHTPSTLKELWYQLRSTSASSNANINPLHANAEHLIDFVANKMNKSWMILENAPQGSLKNRIHGLGLRLLSRVKPSEIFLKSITKEVTNLEIAYPCSLNSRLVRRRIRHIAMRGTIIHKKYLYGSVSMIPLTGAFSVFPLPNIPFFWNLFRTYSHWRALKGSEKLLQLVSNCSHTQNAGAHNLSGSTIEHDDSAHGTHNPRKTTWLFLPSEELDELLRGGDESGVLSSNAIADICKTFDLNTNDVMKYRDSV
ncbi:hypothetical protein HS088_TW17G01007 [Tripterygium wilfordii]|uniref:Uncharacterized protein n=1 Tax=Tripterygium wilfordii TaxID=458696 RepID=A0A7J7CHB9_TRIWF|nr:uncharacterized protein LOC119982184 [Tripterygium wilfordii]KAF5733463.1 hypothetical protein HS088_TW17G01007 [Tripterygium wilfordii]